MFEMADAQGCINTYLAQHVTRNRILDFQGETWKDKRDTERPNKNYARAPGWSNVQYQIRGYIVHPNDLAKVRATQFPPLAGSLPRNTRYWQPSADLPLITSHDCYRSWTRSSRRSRASPTRSTTSSGARRRPAPSMRRPRSRTSTTWSSRWCCRPRRTEAGGKRKLADLESRLKKAEEALAEARAAKKPARPAAAKATAA